MAYKVKYMHCPLMGEKIDDYICFDICLVAENVAPKWSAPEKAVITENFDEICLKCKYHPE
ncbi:MAG: hypothetical protein Q4C55_01280 [Eubacterium sp.]|nr:hypothetical protein [Eubacterium sp.]